MTAASESDNRDKGPFAALGGPLVLVGAGRMGGAMLQGWVTLGLDPHHTVVLEPQPTPEITSLATRGLRLNPPQDGVGATAAAIVLAVKPQNAGEVLPGLAPLFAPATVVVSIMAGLPLHRLAQLLPAGAALVRAMPNTPAAIGRGITVAVANAQVSADQRVLANGLLASTGSVEWTADERLLDAVTALSGSGPAYVFLLAEAMAQAGIAAGLPAELAAKLARETVAGSGELLHRSPLDAATLRRNVTSSGGTTAAALEVLMGEHGLTELMTRAIAAAAKRSQELAD